jgi:hypothetical protein
MCRVYRYTYPLIYQPINRHSNKYINKKTAKITPKAQSESVILGFFVPYLPHYQHHLLTNFVHKIPLIHHGLTTSWQLTALSSLFFTPYRPIVKKYAKYLSTIYPRFTAYLSSGYRLFIPQSWGHETHCLIGF